MQKMEKRKIMIIEDDISLAKATKKQMESWGSEVMCAEVFFICMLTAERQITNLS